jgi:hypothetical protein
MGRLCEACQRPDRRWGHLALVLHLARYDLIAAFSEYPTPACFGTNGSTSAERLREITDVKNTIKSLNEQLLAL